MCGPRRAGPWRRACCARRVGECRTTWSTRRCSSEPAFGPNSAASRRINDFPDLSVRARARSPRSVSGRRALSSPRTGLDYNKGMDATTTDYDARYLAGIQLFNHRDFFEAHEVWEDLWQECAGPERRFYQGLIQAAVGLLHFSN